MEKLKMVKYRIGAVVAEFNFDINQMMLELAKSEAKNRDCEVTRVVMVPGVFDMPLAIKKLIQKDECYRRCNRPRSNRSIPCFPFNH